MAVSEWSGTLIKWQTALDDLYQRALTPTHDRGFPRPADCESLWQTAGAIPMAAPIPLRPDYDGAGLRALARRSKDADQTRRLLALALIYDGGSRRSAASLGGVGLQIIRDWVLRFNAHGPDGLIDRKAPGAVPKLNAADR
ncbi:helix-turn-helix domain-containing protein [Tistrella mobilis]